MLPLTVGRRALRVQFAPTTGGVRGGGGAL